MRIIKYQMKQNDALLSVTIDYNETNLEIAKKEAYNGVYTIEDDGEPEPEKIVTTEDILNALLGGST